MMDVESHFLALKASWVHRIMESDSSNWGFIAKFNLSFVFPNIINFSFDNKRSFPNMKVILEFYQEVLLGFYKAKKVKRPITRDEILILVLFKYWHLQS